MSYYEDLDEDLDMLLDYDADIFRRPDLEFLGRGLEFLGRTTSASGATRGLRNFPVKTSSGRLPELCFAHKTGCTRNCSRLHICDLFLAGICKFGDTCRRGHSLTTSHNKEVCERYGLDTEKELLSIAKLSSHVQEGGLLPEATYHRNLEVCLRYRSSWNKCVEGVCNRLHICRYFIPGECEDAECLDGHDFHTAHNHEVLSRHKANKLTDSELICLLREKLRGNSRQALAAGGAGPSSARGRGATSTGRGRGRGTAARGRGGARGKTVRRPQAEEEMVDEEDAAEGATAAPAPSVSECLQASGIAEELQCPVCLDFLTRATTVQCGHTFCEVCLADVRKANAMCPVCRVRIEHCSRAFALDSVIAGMKKLLPAGDV